MRSLAIFVPLLLSAVAGAAVQPVIQPVVQRPAVTSAISTDVNYALADWRRLRQSDGYAFADYARFVISNPGWPGESGLRRAAEKQMRPGENALTVISFFRSDEPQSGNGWARLAESYAATGKAAEALAAARNAWTSADLSAYDEQSLFARFGSRFTAADHDKRVDAVRQENDRCLPDDAVDHANPAWSIQRAHRHVVEDAGRRNPLSGSYWAGHQ